MNQNSLFILIIVLVALSSSFFINTDSKHNESIKKLLNQSSRWGIASAQDKNPFVKNLHGNYAMGYLIALRDIASDSEIKRITSVDILDFQKDIITIQREAAEEIFKICPGIIPDDFPELTKLSQTF